MQTVSSLQNGSTTPSFNSQEDAKAVVPLKRRRPAGEVQLESGRVDSQHEAAEASEVLQNMDDLDLDPIIMAMRYLLAMYLLAMMIGSRPRSSIF